MISLKTYVIYQDCLLKYTFPAAGRPAVRIKIKAKQGLFALVWLGNRPLLGKSY